MENLKKMTDDVLVTLYQEGNNKAFDELLTRYQNKLYTYIFFVVHNATLAEDLFQETFIKAIMRIQQGRYVKSDKFYAWLTRIAHNLIVDQYRQEHNENTVSNDEVEYDLLNDASLTDLNVEMQMVNEQTLVDVKRLMDHLPENQREVVYMRYFENMSFKDIAEITGVSINTSLGRMRYALLNMRRMAEEKDIALTIY